MSLRLLAPAGDRWHRILSDSAVARCGVWGLHVPPAEDGRPDTPHEIALLVERPDVVLCPQCFPAADRGYVLVDTDEAHGGAIGYRQGRAARRLGGMASEWWDVPEGLLWSGEGGGYVVARGRWEWVEASAWDLQRAPGEPINVNRLRWDLQTHRYRVPGR